MDQWKRISLASLALAMLVMACNEKKADPSKLTITGKLDNLVGKTLLMQDIDGKNTPDTAVIAADGSFVIQMDNPPLGFYRLSHEGMKDPMLMAFDSTQRSIHITGDADDLLKTYSVSGSPDSELLQQVRDLKVAFVAETDSIREIQQQLPADADIMLRKGVAQMGQKSKEAYDEKLKKLAAENSTSVSSIVAISEVDLLKAIPEYKKIRADLETVIPGSDYLKMMDKNIVNLENEAKKQKGMAHLQPGSMAPEISQTTPDGKVVSLSSLRGKYVLIDFWASWCGPCRRENPNVTKLYEKYGGKDFEILGVSLDSNADRWKQAIAQDKLPWLHVSDLKKWSSQAANDYGVRSIPFTVLVDPEGKIVATKLRGQALQQKLAEIFGA